jgi:hypothetical protein
MVSLAAPFFVVSAIFHYCLTCQCSIASADISIEPLSVPSDMEDLFEDSQICCNAVSAQTSQEARTRGGRTDCQTHRLELNLPIDNSVEVSVPLLLMSYREKYPSDPVSEQEFGKLVNGLRPRASETEHRSIPITEKTHADPQDHPVAKQVSPMNNNDEHETINERDGTLDPHTTSIFTEFVNGWRKLRRNGASSNDAAGRPPRRKLDVLSWGFGEC